MINIRSTTQQTLESSIFSFRQHHVYGDVLVYYLDSVCLCVGQGARDLVIRYANALRRARAI